MFVSDSAQRAPSPFKRSPGHKCLITTTKICLHNKTRSCGRENSVIGSASPMFRLLLSHAGKKQMYLNLTQCAPFPLNIKNRAYACCYFRYHKTPGEARAAIRPLCSAGAECMWFLQVWMNTEAQIHAQKSLLANKAYQCFLVYLCNI